MHVLPLLPDCDLETSFTFDKTAEITSYTYAFIIVNTCYTSKGMRVRKVSTSMSDFLVYSRIIN